MRNFTPNIALQLSFKTEISKSMFCTAWKKNICCLANRNCFTFFPIFNETADASETFLIKKLASNLPKDNDLKILDNRIIFFEVNK